MRRTLIIVFLIWLCVGVIPFFLFLHYYSGLPLSMEIVRMIILESFVCLNLTYLFFKLIKIDILYGLILLMLYWCADFIYRGFFKDMDLLTQSLQMEIALAIITIILHFVLKKRSSQD